MKRLLYVCRPCLLIALFFSVLPSLYASPPSGLGDNVLSGFSPVTGSPGSPGYGASPYKYSRLLKPDESCAFPFEELNIRDLTCVSRTEHGISVFSTRPLRGRDRTRAMSHASVYDSVGILDPMELYDRLSPVLAPGLLDTEFERRLRENQALDRAKNKVVIDTVVYEDLQSVNNETTMTWWLCGTIHHMGHRHLRVIRFRGVFRYTGTDSPGKISSWKLFQAKPY